MEKPLYTQKEQKRIKVATTVLLRIKEENPGIDMVQVLRGINKEITERSKVAADTVNLTNKPNYLSKVKKKIISVYRDAEWPAKITASWRLSVLLVITPVIGVIVTHQLQYGLELSAVELIVKTPLQAVHHWVWDKYLRKKGYL